MEKSVVIVEDDSKLRNELVSIVNRDPDLHCLYAVGTGEEALLKIPKNLPDVVLMDIELPGLSGIDCIKILKKNNPRLEIVVLTIYQDAKNIFEALKAGANGYLIKSSDPNLICAAIRDIHSGGAPFTGHIARLVVQHFRTELRARPNDEDLTAREFQVLEFLSSGWMYKEVAKELDITFETVRSHVKSICKKMHVRNRMAAILKHTSKGK